MNIMLDAALRYANLGLRVLALKERQKRPVFDNWGAAATSDRETLCRWWKQNPNYNVGILTGRQSRIFVLDVDKKHGGDETFENLVLKHGRFPDTWQQITGTGGWHLFFRYPNFEVRNAAGLFPGIDIRGEGGQVAAPPSIHPDTGRAYEWDGLTEIEQVPIAEAPLWLLDVLHSKLDQQKPRVEIPTTIPHGVQHMTLLSLAGAMRRMGLSSADIFPTLQAVNLAHCEQPGAEQNIRKIADSMERYAPADKQLYQVAAKLWSLTARREREAQQEQDKLSLKVMDGLEVYRAPRVDSSCVIDQLLYRGVTVFAGRPKQGKSWMVLQFALNVAHGTKSLGKYDVLNPGKVLYLALEETQARTTGRLQKLMSAETPYLQNIKLVYGMNPLFQGGLEQLKDLIDKEAPALVIIDTFLALVGEVRGDKNPMRAEYKEITSLQKLAAETATAILLVHHLRKASMGETMLDAVAGTTGITAAADSIWTLKKEDQREYVLDITGRECEEDSLALKFSADPDCFGWHCLGSGADLKDHRLGVEIAYFLRHEGAQSITRIQGAIKANYTDVRRAIYKLQDEGKVYIDSKVVRLSAKEQDYEATD